MRNYLIFETNDGSGREETSQIELSDDDEAITFGQQVIREMMQVASHWRVYQKAVLTVVLPALPHSEKLSRHGMPFQDHVTQGGDREPSRNSFSARSHRNDEAGS